MAYGDVAPCLVKHCSITGQIIEPEYCLKKGDILKFCDIQSFSYKILNCECFRPLNYSDVHNLPPNYLISSNGQFYFMVMETPISSTFQSALNFSRPETIITRQLQLILQSLGIKIIMLILIVSAIINIFRYIFLETSQKQRVDDAIDLVIDNNFFDLPSFIESISFFFLGSC